MNFPANKHTKKIVGKTHIIFQTSRPKESCQVIEEFIKVFLRSKQRHFVRYSEDPIADGLQGDWLKIEEEHFELIEVGAEFNIQEFIFWLRMGCWELYCSPSPLPPFQAISDNSNPDANEFETVDLIIQAFNDIEWFTAMVATDTCPIT